MRGVFWGVIELAVLHATPGAHALHVARRNALDVTHRVLVRQFTTQHVADDFHVAMTMGAKTGAWCNAVFVDDAQVPKAHVLGVVIAGEGKTVK